jgi:predicted MFS family arabinose efflux permease
MYRRVQLAFEKGREMHERIDAEGQSAGPQANHKTPSPLEKTFWVLLLSRVALNMQMRVIYPFLPATSRGLGVPLGTTSLLLTARAIANLSSPLYGTLSDRYGRRALMLAGLVILTTGTLFVALAPSFGAVLIAVAFLSLCKAVYDPAVLAYVGDTVAYDRRGRIIGILELMWPASWLIGVPLAGFLIDRVSWRAPFVMMFVLGTLSLGLTLRYRAIGAGSQSPQPARQRSRQADLSPWLHEHFLTIPRTAWLAVLVSLLLILASENVYIIYGAWLEDQFGLSLTALGLVSIVISGAEFSAEGVCAGWVDRIGKRRAVIWGIVLNGIAYLLLPGFAGSLVGALLGLFLIYLTFDFSIVSLFPLLSELAPKARGSVMALNVAAMATGRLISSLSAVHLWSAGGLFANALTSTLAVTLALVILVALIRERRPEYEAVAP